MSYCVEYEPQKKKHYPAVIRSSRKLPIGIFIWSAVAIAAVYVLISSGVLRHFIPGDPEVTTTAFSLLVEEIGEGEPVRDAFLSFCREIIVNAS